MLEHYWNVKRKIQLSLRFSFRFNFRFGPVAKTPHEDYHPRSGGDHMGEWKDKFGSKFQQGRDDARLAEQRMHEKSDLLNDKGPKLWKEFKDSLQEAANDIAGPEGFLKYGVTAEVGEEVSLVYALATANRTATITLVGHSVKLLIVEPSGSLLSESYEIVANPKGDGVWFLRQGYGGKTSKELVSVVLGGLLTAPR